MNNRIFARCLKWCLCFVFISVLSFSCCKIVSATTITDAKNKKNEAENKLKDINEDINDIEENREELEREAAEREAELVDLLLSIDIIKKDITNKENEIAIAKEEYDAAVEKELSQKEAMNKRIKFMYEKGEKSYVELLLQSRNYVDSINKAAYTEKLYEYDRYLLIQYEETKEEVKIKEQTLEEDLDELEEIKADSLEQQMMLEAKIDEYSEQIEDFNDQLRNARQIAKNYQLEVEKQSASIKKLEEAEKKRKEEEAKKLAEEAAKKKAAEEAAKKKAAEEEKKKAAEEEKAKTNKDNDAGEGNSEDGKDPLEGLFDDDKDTGDTTKEPEKETEPVKEQEPVKAPNTGSAKGQEIANYALQFVGNPYVPGGTSLTDGCDCSGFTQSVYANFGISIPRTSSSQASCGREVSYADAAPGDIIYYGGHVGLYIGNGQIVHASTQQTGIKISSALYRSIITVRRIVE